MGLHHVVHPAYVYDFYVDPNISRIRYVTQYPVEGYAKIYTQN